MSPFEVACGTALAPNKFEGLPTDEATMTAVVAPMVAAAFSTAPRNPIDAGLPGLAEAAALQLHGAMPFLKTNYVQLDGDAASFAATRAACKRAGVTLNGAYTAAFAAAYSRIRSSMDKVPGKVQCTASYCFDMRPRNAAVLPANAIGNYFNSSAVQPLSSGVDLETPFWKNAKDVVEATKADMSSPMPSFVMKVIDSTLVTPSFTVETLKKMPGGVVEGCVLSNTGNFPGATDYAFAAADASGAGGDGLALTASYCICGFNQASFELCHWFQTVAGKPTYSASFKLDRAFGERLLRNAATVYEAIGGIGEDESIGTVAERLLGAQY